MTNLSIIFQLYDVQSHNQENVKELLTVHLPKEYTSLVLLKLQNLPKVPSEARIRNVKGGITKDIVIFNAIIEVAQEYKSIAEKLKENIASRKAV